MKLRVTLYHMYIVCLVCLKSLIKLNSILFWWSQSCDCSPLFFFSLERRKLPIWSTSEACCDDTILQLMPQCCPLYLGIVTGCLPFFLCGETKRKESQYWCLLFHTHSDKTVQMKIIRWWKALSRNLEIIKTLLDSKDDGT